MCLTVAMLLSLSFSLCLPDGRAQTASPSAESQPTPDKNAPEMSSRDTPATFKAKVNLVLVPVVVRDAQGHAIGNLRQEDFQLFDKGKPQVISRFSVEKSAGQTLSEKRAADVNSPDKSAAAPVAMPERYVAYVFDDVHLAFGDLARVRDAADRHLASLEPTDRAAIYTTSGQTMLEFTDDRAKLHATLLRLQPRPITGSGMPECPDVTYYMADLIQNKSDQQALQVAGDEAMICLGLDPSKQGSVLLANQSARSAAIRKLSAGDHETRIALNVIRDVARRMAGMPGLRNIVLVSPGFFTGTDRLQDKTELIDRAIRSNVIISALDARGLYTTIPGGDASERGTTISPMSAGARVQYQTDSAFVQSDVLAELAHGTGGTFFNNSNDLDEGFRRVAARPEYFYILGFSPQNLKMDGTFHNLKITLKDVGKVNLQARRGYYAPRHLDDPAETAKREIEEALFSREELHDLPVEMHTQFFKASDELAKVTVLVRVNAKQLRFRKAEGRNRNDLTIASALFDRNGNYVAGIEKHLEMRLKDETLENKLRSGLTVKTNFDVKPGTYLVRLVVRDSEGQLMSAENGSVEIP